MTNPRPHQGSWDADIYCLDQPHATQGIYPQEPSRCLHTYLYPDMGQEQSAGCENETQDLSDPVRPSPAAPHKTLHGMVWGMLPMLSRSNLDINSLSAISRTTRNGLRSVPEVSPFTLSWILTLYSSTLILQGTVWGLSPTSPCAPLPWILTLTYGLLKTRPDLLLYALMFGTSAI